MYVFLQTRDNCVEMNSGQISAVKSEGKFIYKWDIDESLKSVFLKNRMEIIQTAPEIALVSPEISLSPFNFFIVLLELKPKLTHQTSEPGDLLIYLGTLSNVPMNVAATLAKVKLRSVSILKNDDEVIPIQRGHFTSRLTERCKQAGILEYIYVVEQRIRIDGKDILVLNGKLAILCEITIYDDSLVEKHCALEDTHKFTDNDNFEKFLNNEKFSDVKFILHTEEFYAHKNLLANKSEVFAAMFDHNMTENVQVIVEIEDIAAEVFRELLRYIYAGQVNGIRKNAEKLLIAADKYALEELKNVCAKYLCEDLSIYNVLKYINIADTYSVNDLRKKALDFIVNHAEDIVDIPGIKIEDLPEDIIGEVIHRLASQGKYFRK